MKYVEVGQVDPGTLLVVNDVAFIVHQVSLYRCRTDNWLNLVSKTVRQGEKVLELSEGKIRQWTQVLDMPDEYPIDPSMDFVCYRGRHFEVDESRVRAKVETRTTKGETLHEDSVTSVYVDINNDEILLSVEKKGDKLFIWYSDTMVSPRNIQKSK